MGLSEQKRKEWLAKIPLPQKAKDLPKTVNLFFYGDHGKWKTTTACRIGASRGRVLLITGDRDDVSLHNHPELLANTNVETFTSDSLDKVKVISEFLLHQESGWDQFATVVFEVGGWVEDCLVKIAENVSYGEKSRTAISPTGGDTARQFIKDMEIVASERGDYGTIRNQLRSFIPKLINAPCNVVFVCHARNADKSINSNNDGIRPDLPEKAFEALIRKCDALGYFESVNSGDPITRWDLSNAISTKSRLGFLTGKRLKVMDTVKLINNYLER